MAKTSTYNKKKKQENTTCVPPRVLEYQNLLRELRIQRDEILDDIDDIRNQIAEYIGIAKGTLSEGLLLKIIGETSSIPLMELNKNLRQKQVELTQVDKMIRIKTNALKLYQSRTCKNKGNKHKN